jgi:ornithine carbamoyltransferase
LKKDFLAITDWSKEEILTTLALAAELKAKQKKGVPHAYLAGKNMAMIFQKPSSRTRVSFQIGMYQLGGQSVYLGPNDIGLGKRESIPDISQTLSRYVDVIMARLFGHHDIVKLAESAGIPVINGLTDLLHPCQVMADMQTIFEHKGKREDLKIAWIGDGNNVANSWLNMAARYPMYLALAVPQGFEPDSQILEKARKKGLSQIDVVRVPEEAARDADVIYADVWASMGQEDEADTRRRAFRNFQVDEKLMRLAARDCVFMHCLPAHRGEEVSAGVIDGPQSIVFDEAENRLHAQKAILVRLFE